MHPAKLSRASINPTKMSQVDSPVLELCKTLLKPEFAATSDPFSSAFSRLFHSISLLYSVLLFQSHAASSEAMPELSPGF
jgi:hypothetical protein